MDTLDHQLIGLLRNDARLERGRARAQARVSRGTVTNRITRLRTRASSSAYTVRLRPDAQPHDIHAWTSIAVGEGNETRTVIASLLGEPAVAELPMIPTDAGTYSWACAPPTSPSCSIGARAHPPDHSIQSSETSIHPFGSKTAARVLRASRTALHRYRPARHGFGRVTTALSIPVDRPAMLKPEAPHQLPASCCFAVTGLSPRRSSPKRFYARSRSPTDTPFIPTERYPPPAALNAPGPRCLRTSSGWSHRYATTFATLPPITAFDTTHIRILRATPTVGSHERHPQPAGQPRLRGIFITEQVRAPTADPDTAPTSDRRRTQDQAFSSVTPRRFGRPQDRLPSHAGPRNPSEIPGRSSPHSTKTSSRPRKKLADARRARRLAEIPFVSLGATVLLSVIAGRSR